MNYYKVMLGGASIYAQQALQGGFIGVDYEINQDLSGDLPDDWREFNHKFIPVYLEGHPKKSKIAAGLACGALWTICRELQLGDTVLSPSGTPGNYLVGEVTGSYVYVPGQPLPHRRAVTWRAQPLLRETMTTELKHSAGGVGAVINLSKYRTELSGLLQGLTAPVTVIDDEIVEDLQAFEMEKYLEDFLVSNWASTELGKQYDLYTEDGEMVGRQYPTDTGPLDILAISKDRRTLLVVELKRGRPSDRVVGQILRYMGYVQQELAEADQEVRGVIIALEDDLRVRRALAVTKQVSFYRYQISFKLQPVGV